MTETLSTSTNTPAAETVDETAEQILSTAALMRKYIRTRFKQEGVLPSTLMRLRLGNTAIALDLNRMTVLIEKDQPGPGNTEHHWIDGVPLVPLDGEEEPERVWRTEATRSVDTIFPAPEPDHKSRKRVHLFGRKAHHNEAPHGSNPVATIEGSALQSDSDIVRLFRWIDEAVLIEHGNSLTLPQPHSEMSQ